MVVDLSGWLRAGIHPGFGPAPAAFSGVSGFPSRGGRASGRVGLAGERELSQVAGLTRAGWSAGGPAPRRAGHRFGTLGLLLTAAGSGCPVVTAAIRLPILMPLWAKTPNPHQVWAPSSPSNRVRSQPNRCLR